MKIFRILILSIYLVFPSAIMWSKPNVIIYQSISAEKTKTGEVIHLKWHIQGNAKTKVSWEALDFLFRQSDKLTVLKISTTTTSEHLVKHQIDFTVTTPQHITVKGFPVIVAEKKFLTPPFKLNVKASGLPLKISPISPIVSVEMNALLLSWFYVFILLFVTGILMVISCRRFDVWYQKRKDMKTRQRILDQLRSLEHAAYFENLATASVVRQINELMKQYKSLTAVSYPVALEEHAAKLLFLPDAVAKAHYAEFFIQIKRCLDTSQCLS